MLERFEFAAATLAVPALNVKCVPSFLTVSPDTVHSLEQRYLSDRWHVTGC
jgi:hypothetical protein